MNLTDDELRLLRDLKARGGEATMSGNQRHADLDRLVENGLMTRQVARGTTDVMIYTLTEKGDDMVGEPSSPESRRWGYGDGSTTRS